MLDTHMYINVDRVTPNDPITTTMPRPLTQ